MIFILISVLVSIVIYFFLPTLVEVVTGKRAKSNIILALACLCFFISWYLPSPLIEGQQTQFMTHFVGGGIFSGLLWLHIKKQLELKWNLFFDLLAIYILTSSLGVANELFEFVIAHLNLVKLSSSDTWWDLFANTLGAVGLWLLFCCLEKWRRAVSGH